METVTTRCCIVGGGPAGIMLGYLLARAGVPALVLEKHGDFLRDFRGDTVHPSTLQVLSEIGLLSRFADLPQVRVRNLAIRVGNDHQQVVDFRGLAPFDYLALVPQWDFLNLIAAEGRRRYPHFDLRMNNEATGLIEHDGRIAGVHVRSPRANVEVMADLVVDCSGRQSALGGAAGLRARNYGAPMDVLWFRVPRDAADPPDAFAIIGTSHMMVLLNRSTYWQVAYVVPKGSDRRLRGRPVDELRDAVGVLAPFLATRTGAISSWHDIKTLEVRVDRLDRWYRSGLLLIGDAAHAMSPIGGVGINLAIQDAVAAANALTPALRAGGPVGDGPLRAVQARRQFPTRVVQWVQLQVQRRLIGEILQGSTKPPTFPRLLRWLLQSRAVRNIPARFIGYGIRPEHVRFGTGDGIL